MIKKDIIYQDDQYTIVKKGADDIGTFTPADMYHLLFVGLKELQEWDGGGLTKESLIQMKARIIEELEKIS